MTKHHLDDYNYLRDFIWKANLMRCQIVGETHSVYEYICISGHDSEFLRNDLVQNICIRKSKDRKYFSGFFRFK